MDSPRAPALRALLTCALLWSGQFAGPANLLQMAVEEVKVELCWESGGSAVLVSRRLMLRDDGHVSGTPFGEWKPVKRWRLRVEPAEGMP